ncbi:MerR family transcriptional regulator [uncultured Sphingomonas sp.]|uniref:MerR family transcriptional regulator n=1 Tax=uncultured Sphingomonas sp. TaxID=158754 RepID=UPI0035CB0567
MGTPPKAAGAFRTIGEVAAELNVAQHVLRYWETRFPQLRPLQRAGNRRYYRPEDVTLARRIDELLNRDGYTVKGVQQLLAREGGAPVEAVAPPPDAMAFPDVLATLRAIRAGLTDALRADEA